MILNDLKPVLFSLHGNLTLCIVYDKSTDIDIETGCTAEYALANYGFCELYRIQADNDYIVLEIYRDREHKSWQE